MRAYASSGPASSAASVGCRAAGSPGSPSSQGVRRALALSSSVKLAADADPVLRAVARETSPEQWTECSAADMWPPAVLHRGNVVLAGDAAHVRLGDRPGLRADRRPGAAPAGAARPRANVRDRLAESP